MIPELFTHYSENTPNVAADILTQAPAFHYVLPFCLHLEVFLPSQHPQKSYLFSKSISKATASVNYFLIPQTPTKYNSTFFETL